MNEPLLVLSEGPFKEFKYPLTEEEVEFVSTDLVKDLSLPLYQLLAMVFDRSPIKKVPHIMALYGWRIEGTPISWLSADRQKGETALFIKSYLISRKRKYDEFLGDESLQEFVDEYKKRIAKAGEGKYERIVEILDKAEQRMKSSEPTSQ